MAYGNPKRHSDKGGKVQKALGHKAKQEKSPKIPDKKIKRGMGGKKDAMISSLEKRLEKEPM